MSDQEGVDDSMADDQNAERSSGEPTPTAAPAEPTVTRQRRIIEIFAAVLLALAAVAAAWAGYQSARWGGVQATETAESGAARLESSRASATGGNSSRSTSRCSHKR